MAETKKSSDRMSFILHSHPEIFKIQPRPGGAVFIKDFKPLSTSTPNEPEGKVQKKTSEMQHKSSEIKKTVPLEEKTSREFRIQTALDFADSVISVKPPEPNPLQDAMYVISITISTVMAIAAEHENIPTEYKTLTELCLRSIRDQFGNRPPNVQGILNSMRQAQEENKQNAQETKDQSKPPANEGGKGSTKEGRKEDEAAENVNEGKTVKTTTRMSVQQ